MRKFILMMTAVLVMALACTKEVTNETPNPFEDQTEQDTSTTRLDLSTIQGLHQNVFAVRCANPTCHDGSFEPDFRTVQSTYSSLVYHPVTKNDPDDPYAYRVYPGKADKSWLFHRVTTEDEKLGRMPLYANPLPQKQIDAIKKWINDGAKDASGNPPSFPNLPPTVYGYQTFDVNDERVDTNRVNGWASPMTLSHNTTYTMAFYVEDDTSATADLKNHKLEFSLDRDNFTPFAQLGATMLWDNVMIVSLNTSQFSSNTVIYFRYYLEDEQGASTQMPNDQSQFYWKDNFSLIVQ